VEIVTVDYFGDMDTRRLGPHVSLRERGLGYSAAALARVARELRYDAIAYCGGLENHPDVVAELADGRVLLGNTPQTLRRVRDPAVLFPFLAARGFAVPETIVAAGPAPRRPGTRARWLVKPAAGGGGQGVRVWRGQRVPARHILQRRIVGVSGSAALIANGERSVVLGWSRQLHAPTPFRYGGSLLPLPAPASTLDELRRLGDALTAEFGLVGLNGIDFVVREARPVVVEVNPRYSASMELVERATGLGLFALHQAACEGRLPDPGLAAAALSPRGAAGVHGKLIVYARHSVVVSEPRRWLEQGVRDVPHPGEVMRAGQPICTVLASAPSPVACLVRLRAEEAVILRACAARPSAEGAASG
jgi:predicted ATP-grasp superfamily ATP-dependent carboligase